MENSVSNIFFISDSHFGHNNICHFDHPNGKEKLRPWTNAEEMDEALVKNWNEVVKPEDKVYHLGDVAMNSAGLKVLARLNGDKVLIKGNHDIEKLRQYTPYFRDIRGYLVKDKIIYSHIPIHPESKGRFKANVHGHLHGRRVMMETYKQVIDPFYFCVSVENINFRPIAYEELLLQLSNQNPNFNN